MTAKRKAGIGKWLLIAVLLAVVTTAGAAYYLTASRSSSTARAAEERENQPTDGVHVEVTQPLKGAMPLTTTQPGSVQSFESADLYAGASGYLGRVKAPPTTGAETGREDIGEVDIGDHVKKGDVLAKVEAPDLNKQVQEDEAQVEAAQARVVSAGGRGNSQSGGHAGRGCHQEHPRHRRLPGEAVQAHAGPLRHQEHRRAPGG